MASISTSYHEDIAELAPETRERHRAIASLIEELQAIDWYDQRIEVSSDAELQAVLAHNRDEEIEHAVMLLEWLRRRVAKVDQTLRTYLFTALPIIAVEAAAEGRDGNAPMNSAAGDLGIGNLTRKD
jgi:uncharacterized protein